MAGFIIRQKLSAADAIMLVDKAREFFAANRRKRIFTVGDDSGVWFKVRRAHILLDIQVHSADFVCEVCGSKNLEATKEGLIFCYRCAINEAVKCWHK